MKNKKSIKKEANIGLERKGKSQFYSINCLTSDTLEETSHETLFAINKAIEKQALIYILDSIKEPYGNSTLNVNTSQLTSGEPSVVTIELNRLDERGTPVRIPYDISCQVQNIRMDGSKIVKQLIEDMKLTRTSFLKFSKIKIKRFFKGVFHRNFMVKFFKKLFKKHNEDQETLKNLIYHNSPINPVIISIHDLNDELNEEKMKMITERIQKLGWKWIMIDDPLRRRVIGWQAYTGEGFRDIPYTVIHKALDSKYNESAQNIKAAARMFSHKIPLSNIEW